MGLINDPNELRPSTRARFVAWWPTAQAIADRHGCTLDLLETYRPPTRQAKLYAQGRTEPGEIVTNNPGPGGAHPERRGFDWLPRKGGVPVWYRSGAPAWVVALYRDLIQSAERAGFISGSRFGTPDENGIGWDAGHCEDRP